MDLIEGKQTLQEMDVRIVELQTRLKLMQSARTHLAAEMCNHVLNSAAACDRDCCGSKPRQLFISAAPCHESPIGTCVFSQLKDPAHDHCLFCHTSEYSGG